MEAINTALAQGNKGESAWVYSGEAAGKNKGLIELPLADMGKLFGQLKELDALEAEGAIVYGTASGAGVGAGAGLGAGLGASAGDEEDAPMTRFDHGSIIRAVSS